MLATAGEIARERGLEAVEAPFVRSQRNTPALLFLESVGLQYQQSRHSGSRFRFPAEVAARISYHPGKSARAAQPETKATPRQDRKTIDYVRIAAESQDAAKLAERLRVAARPANTDTVYVAPRSDLERRLVEIWEATLQVSPIGVRDNFFDLGGHSLLAVELLSRVRQAVGAEVSLEVVYGSEFTVEELARAIELRELEDVDSAEYAALLAEVENLSDEEVRELLANESGSCESS
jgi:hypothetical protein